MRGSQLASAAEIVLRFIPAIKLFHIAPRSALERHQPGLEAHERLPHSQISPRGLGKLSIVDFVCYVRHGSKIGSQQSDRLRLVGYYGERTSAGVRATERIDKIKRCTRLSGARA